MGAIQDMDPVNLRAAIYYYDVQDFINDNGITSPGTGFGSNCLYNIPHFKLWGGEIEASLGWTGSRGPFPIITRTTAQTAPGSRKTGHTTFPRFCRRIKSSSWATTRSGEAGWLN
ncbi:MAG: hypothetical protein J7M20_03650 [Deltaproteobacteria bacterium]|nr:hypothetical protein [Deltaproteobacteria bacterium]